MPGLNLRPFLTTYELAGGAAADADLQKENAQAQHDKNIRDNVQFGMQVGQQMSQMQDQQAINQAMSGLLKGQGGGQNKGGTGGGGVAPASANSMPATSSGAGPALDAKAPGAVVQVPSLATPTFAPPNATADVSAPAQPQVSGVVGGGGSNASITPTTPQSQAPAQAPVVQQSSDQGSPQPQAAATPQSQAPAQAPAPQASAPMPVPAPAQAQLPASPAPVVPAAPADTSVPATSAEAAAPTPAAAPKSPEQVRQSVRSTPEVNGIPNILSDDFYNKRVEIVQQLMADGKISARSGEAYIQNMTDARNKQLESLVKIQKDLAEVREKNANAREKAVAARASIRSEEDNYHNDVYSALKNGDLPRARQMADEYGLTIDFNNPSDLKTLEMRAKRSKEYQSGNEIITTGLPDGYYRKGKTGNTVYTTDENGNERQVGQKEIESFRTRVAAAGAPKVVNYGATQQTEFAKNIGKQDAELINTVTNKMQTSKQAFDQYKQIHDVVTQNPNMPSGPTGGVQALAARLFGNDKEQANLFARNLVQQASSNLELITAQANKGQGSFSDSERMIMKRASSGDSNFTPNEWKTFSRAMMKAEQIKQQNLNGQIKSVQGRNKDVDVTSYMAPVSQSGIPEVDQSNTPAQAAGVTKPTNLKGKYGF